MTDIDKHGATDFVLSSEHLSQKPLEVSNADFIKIAFQGLAYQAGEGNSPCPLGVRFHGDPCHGNWTAVRLVNESIPSAADENKRVCNFLWAARSRLIDVGGDSVTK